MNPDRNRVKALLSPRPTLAQLYEAAEEVTGDIWKPHLVVSHEDDDGKWYWKDLAATDGWYGPFDTERAAVENFLALYEVEVG